VRIKTDHGTSFTVNLGLGGYCSEQLRILPVGTRLEGYLSLDGADVRFVGHVAWATSGEYRLNQPGRMGVRFVRVDRGFDSSLEHRAARSRSRKIDPGPAIAELPGIAGIATDADDGERLTSRARWTDAG
jgi:hypothetical protein